MRSHSLRRVCVLREIKKQKIEGDKVEIWRDGEMDGEIDAKVNGKDGKRMERRMNKLGDEAQNFGPNLPYQVSSPLSSYAS